MVVFSSTFCEVRPAQSCGLLAACAASACRPRTEIANRSVSREERRRSVVYAIRDRATMPLGVREHRRLRTLLPVATRAVSSCGLRGSLARNALLVFLLDARVLGPEGL